jgi:5-formyltetrahydrofolate cyclo-ligase
MLNKANLRQTLIAKRAAIDPNLRAQWDEEIGRMLLAWWQMNPVPVLGVYWPIRGEPDLRDTYVRLAAQGVQLALPVVVKKEAPLAFARWVPGDAVVKDGYGISVPATFSEMKPAALLIPCVGFDDQRYRLGYGGGFYDRTLALHPRPQAVGIAYACMQADFEIGRHDIALDAVITEQACF